MPGGGTTTASLYFGGIDGPNATVGKTEVWNGSNWTEVNDMNSARSGLGAAGTSTSALGFGGSTPPYSVLTELYNGTNWTAVGNLNSARAVLAGMGDTSTAALYAGGYYSPPAGYIANTEDWNGTAWAEVADLNTARGNQAASGTPTAGYVFSGEHPPGLTTSSEEWSGSTKVIKVLTD